ncbi:hypothetical protein Vadar_006836 [Vaccinium darrowii]|uniref:Uncharacterized protein n=1 Tax=Vaccinium darrowii TaxID=229202 RepID=A0ACB7XFW9_9ERIC|nr:hypothetical protein Vadar_006836 [Vaccinium darrowii]
MIVVVAGRWFHQYQVVGRGLPLETDGDPKIYRMKLWATNKVRAKSKFWYFLRKLKKVRKSNGQIIAINEGSPPLHPDHQNCYRSGLALQDREVKAVPQLQNQFPLGVQEGLGSAVIFCVCSSDIVLLLGIE